MNIMEKLEKTIEQIQIKTENGETKSSYAGLELLEERSYSDGTSIMYWM